MYPGQSVVVNPQAGGTQVLLYPDGVHTRTVPVLRQPGVDNGVIHLHMPVKRKVVVHRAPKPETDVASLDTPDYSAPPPVQQAPAPKPTKVASLPPAPKPVAQPKPAPVKTAPPPKAASQPTQTASNGGAVPFSFSPGASYTPAPPQSAQPQAPAPKPTKLAANTPPPATTSPSNQSPGAGFSRRSQIIFAANAGDPAPNALDAIRMLGGDLNSALNGGAQKIQLQAYGGSRSDKSSDARRLSLKRALAIRNILIEAGVPSGKIDVRAMGGADDGPLDRVDVYVRS
jgi:outer membrane protein OmpA-like peptidoglycan-associated protein